MQRREAPPTTPDEHRPGSEIRKLSREECLWLLATHHFGRVAVRLGDGPPAIRPVNYLFDRASQAVVLRSDPGSKLYALLRATRAAFEVDGVDDGSRTGWSVIIQGMAEEITNAAELRRLERSGFAPWAPGPKRHWVRIRTETVSGRRIVLDADPIPGRYLG
jgi:uncharacterized protein